MPSKHSCYFFLQLFFLFTDFSSFDLDSNKYNYFVFEDSSGNIWISSQEGWTKFNGERKVNYWANETLGFEGQYVQSNIFEDSDYNLYFTTYEYLIKYDPKFNVFKSFQLFIDENIEYSIIAINDLENHLYLTANNKLIIYDFHSQEIVKVINNDVKSKRFAIAEDYNFIIGCPWINGDGIEIFICEDDKWVKQKLFESVINPNLDPTLKFQNVIIDNNIIWVLGNNFICKIDRIENRIIEKYDYNPESNFNDFVLFSGHLILSTKKEGLVAFDINNGSFFHPEKFKFFRSKSISRLNLLARNRIMLSFPNEGVQYVELEPMYSLIDGVNESLHLANHGNSNIIGVSNKGTVFLLDSMNNVVLKESLSNLTSNSIIDIAYDSNEGITYFLTISSILLLKDNSNSFEKLNSFSDRQLFSFGKFDETITVNSSKGVSNLRGDTISSLTMFFCNNSQVVYSSGSEGVQFWTCSNNTFYYRNEEETFKFDCSGFINDIYYNDELIIISNSIGVDLFKRKEHEFVHLVFSNCELENKQFFGCTKTKNDLFIFTSEEGLIVSDDFFNNYSIERCELDLNNKPPFISSDFDIYFSSYSGINVLDENKFQNLKKNNLIHVESIFVDGQKHSDFQANFIDTINIDFSKKNVDFEIDIVNFQLSSGNYIRYKYNGLSNDWNCMSTLRPVNIPIFKYGKFKFVVQYLNGSYLIDEKIIQINIAPPFHQTWWFRILAVSTLIGIGFSINFYQTKKKLRAKQIELDRQKALQSQRNRMSHDLHDEMGSGLSTIRYISKSLEKEQSQQKVLQIENIASSLIQNMRDLLWSLDESNDTIAGWHSKVRQTVNQMSRNTGLNSSINLTKDHNDVAINGIVRRNLILVLKEAINNVLKHANAEIISISTLIESNQLIFIVADNGKGFDLSGAKLRQRRYGLESMKERVEQLEGKLSILSNSKGTTLKISIPIESYD